ncbi:ABC transporter permease [bacterium]|nr:ABC transporter permease [bacterium]
MAELYRFRSLVWVLARRDLVGRYRGTFLGFGWSFLHPLISLGACYLVFSRVARLPIEHYAAFAFSSLLPWSWFSSALLISSTSIFADAALVKRATCPPSVPPLVAVTATTVNFLLQLPFLLAVLLLDRVQLTPWALLLPLVIVLQLAISTGLGIAIAALSVHYRDVAQLAQTLMPILFLVTPIAYSSRELEAHVPGLLGQAVVWGNPLAVLARTYQRILVGPGGEGGEAPEPLALAILAGFAAISLLFGMAVLEALRDRIPEEI